MQEMRIFDQKLDFCETTFSRQLVRFCSFARVQQAIRDVTDRLLYPRPVLERREKSIGISRPESKALPLSPFTSPYHFSCTHPPQDKASLFCASSLSVLSSRHSFSALFHSHHFTAFSFQQVMASSSPPPPPDPTRNNPFNKSSCSSRPSTSLKRAKTVANPEGETTWRRRDPLEDITNAYLGRETPPRLQVSQNLSELLIGVAT